MGLYGLGFLTFVGVDAIAKCVLNQQNLVHREHLADVIQLKCTAAIGTDHSPHCLRVLCADRTSYCTAALHYSVYCVLTVPGTIYILLYCTNDVLKEELFIAHHANANVVYSCLLYFLSCCICPLDSPQRLQQRHARLPGPRCVLPGGGCPSLSCLARNLACAVSRQASTPTNRVMTHQSIHKAVSWLTSTITTYSIDYTSTFFLFFGGVSLLLSINSSPPNRQLVLPSTTFWTTVKPCSQVSSLLPSGACLRFYRA